MATFGRSNAQRASHGAMCDSLAPFHFPDGAVHQATRRAVDRAANTATAFSHELRQGKAVLVAFANELRRTYYASR